MALTDDEQAELLSKVRDIWDQLRGPGGAGWPQLGQNGRGQDLTPVDAIAAIKRDVESPADLQASKQSPAQQASS